MRTRFVATATPIDLVATLSPIWRGPGDRTMRVSSGEVWRASRTPEGAVAVRFAGGSAGVRVEAWGAGAPWILERAPEWVGALDGLEGFDPPPGLVRDLWRRHRGVRITRTSLLTERLIPLVLEQKVTGLEAKRAYRRMTSALAEPAPGPASLLLPPDPERLAALPYYAMHPFGVERGRSDVIRSIGRRAGWIDEAASLPLELAKERIGSLRGIGPWTVAEVARTALGDGDAVSVGDFHVPHLVSWALAREPRGTDERMLELLEPYRPHRGLVQLLLEGAGIRPPAFGPRVEPRAIDRL